jgi:DNA-binding MarR family transcriptional regulator
MAERADEAAREVGEALLRVAAHLEELLEDAAGAEQLSALEARLLREAADPTPQSLLADRLGCGPSRVSVLTRELVGRDLLALTQGRGDQRTRWAHLTGEGEAVLTRIGERLRATSPLLSALDDDDRTQLAVLLAQLDPLQTEAADP